jgi:hypothetical protein
MKKPNSKELIYWGLGGLAVYFLLFRIDPKTGKSGLTTILQNIGATAGAAPVTLVTSAAGSAIDSVEQAATGALNTVTGFPVVSQTKCQQDITAKDAWNASFDCSSGDYLAAFGPQTWFGSGS